MEASKAEAAVGEAEQGVAIACMIATISIFGLLVVNAVVILALRRWTLGQWKLV